jgi:dihydroorotase
VIIKNGTICDKRGENKADIRIENGFIKKIAHEILPLKNEEVIDATGQYILPGAIDINCSLGISNQNIFKTLQKIEADAIKGGVCTIAIQPDTPINTEIGLDYIVSKSKELSLTDVSVVSSAVENNDGDKLNNMAIMYKNGAVGAYISSDANSNFLRRSMEYSAMYGRPIFVSLQNKSLDMGGVMTDSARAFGMGLTPLQNATESTEMVKISEMSYSYSSVAVVNSISLARSTLLAKQIKSRREKTIFCTDLHYFSLSHEECAKYNSFAKVNPPLRQDEDIKGIKTAIKDGVISCIASGHVPVRMGNKDVAFEEASFGIESLALFLPICYTFLVKDGTISLAKLSELTSHNPANIIGAKDKGLVKVGYSADLVIFDTNVKCTKQSVSKFDSYQNGPYNDKELYGAVLALFKDGKRML